MVYGPSQEYSLNTAHLMLNNSLILGLKQTSHEIRTMIIGSSNFIFNIKFELIK
jgi:hypothetical protein